MDDAIYWSKNNGGANVTDVFQFNHWLQWSTSRALTTTSDRVQLWTSYAGWDSQVVDATKPNFVVATTSTGNFGGSAGLNVIANILCGADWSVAIPTDQTVAKNACAAGVNNVNINQANQWFPTVPASGTGATAVPAQAGRLVSRISQTFNGDPVIKVGDTVSYNSGFVWGANKGTSTRVSWKVVDGASALVMTGVAAAIATLAF